MKQSVFFLVFIAALLISCKKKYHVVGRAYNPITGQGLANLKVEFIKTNTEFPGGYDEVASTWTDANGNYEIEYKGRAERVKLDGSGGYYGLGTLYNGSYEQAIILEHKKTQEIDWHLVGYGQLTTTLTNISCEDANDVIVLNATYRAKPSATIFGTGTYDGCYNNTSTSSDIPMGYYDFTWTVTKTSTGTNTFTGEVFVPEGGIGEITINY